MENMDLDLVDISICMSQSAQHCAEDVDDVTGFFNDLLKKEIDSLDGKVNLSTVAENVNAELFKKYGMLFYMRAVDDDTDEAPDEDATEITLILDTLQTYNRTLH